MNASIPVENGNPLRAIQGFLQKLLELAVVEALLVPMRTPDGTVTTALVVDPGLLEAADPLAPVLPVNSATLAGKLSVRTPRVKIGVVARACELRALVELVKLQQACLEDMLLIAVDCAGTFSLPEFIKNGNGDGVAIFQAIQADPDAAPPDRLRQACKICEQPVYHGAQISIELFGCDLQQEVHISLPDGMAERLGLAAAAPGGRAEFLDKLVAAREARRAVEFAAIRARLEGERGLPGVFAACIRCHNCMTVCPICYCKTCVFKSQVFDHEPLQFVNWARQKGACRMPADTQLFHLTRLNHMVLSCVGCGMCSEACPAELPVGLVFRAIGQRVQAVFEYLPGRSLEEPLPLVTFKADEWTEVGE